MAFKMLKDWFYVAFGGRRSRYGNIIVSSTGEAIVIVKFKPDFLEVFFTDEEPPIDPCHPHAPDSCSITMEWLGFREWGVKINWSVYAVRHLKYEIGGQP